MDELVNKALELKKSGRTCSYSIYYAFKDHLHLDDNYPAPRSIEGRCGCLLVLEKILKDIGKEDRYQEFYNRFIDEYHYDKCFDLIKNNGRRCDEYVEKASEYISKIIKEK